MYTFKTISMKNSVFPVLHLPHEARQNCFSKPYCQNLKSSREGCIYE